jgi:transcriptional regulator with XRE-family HTH domain
MKIDNRDRILNQPSYWIENVNALLYNAIVDYMEKHEMKQKDLAKHLNISTGRVSQILNDGDINFSLEKVIQIALKVGMYPFFKLEKKSSLLEKELNTNNIKSLVLDYNAKQITNPSDFNDYDSSTKKEAKIISIESFQNNKIAL